MLHANEFHDARNLALKHRGNDIRRNVARADAGSTRSEDHIDSLLFRLFDLLFQLSGIVGNQDAFKDGAPMGGFEPGGK